jgi:hypothetical protein
MAQTFTDNTYDGTHNAATDLENMEDNFAALKSSFSGTASPGSAVTGQLHMDTDNHVLKMYDTAWRGLMHGDTSQKIWVYRNDAMDGWMVDSSVSDRVLAFKGGTTYTTGGAGAGSWTHGHADTFGDHNHQWYAYTSTSVTAKSYDSAGAPQNISTAVLASGPNYHIAGARNTGDYIILGSRYTAKSTSPGSVTDNTAWRPLASVGTLQYLDI